MSNVNTNTQVTTTNTNNSKETPVKTAKSMMQRFNTAANHVQKAANTTGSAIVNSVATGHTTGCKYVAKVIDKVNAQTWLVVDETKEGALATAKAIAQKLTKATILVFAVPVAYAAGFVVGAGKGFFQVFKDAYSKEKATPEQEKVLAEKGTVVATEEVDNTSN